MNMFLYTTAFIASVMWLTRNVLAPMAGKGVLLSKTWGDATMLMLLSIMPIVLSISVAAWLNPSPLIGLGGVLSGVVVHRVVRRVTIKLSPEKEAARKERVAAVGLHYKQLSDELVAKYK